MSGDKDEDGVGRPLSQSERDILLRKFVDEHWDGPLTSIFDGKTYKTPEAYRAHLSKQDRLLKHGLIPHENAESLQPIAGSTSTRRRSTGHRYFSDRDIEKIIATCPSGLPSGQIEIQQANPDGSGLIPHIVDRRTALEVKLQGVGARFVMFRSYEKSPPSESRKRFQTIENAASKLQKALRLPENKDPNEIPPAILHPLQRQAERTGRRTEGFQTHFEWTLLRAAVEAVEYLRTWAAGAKEIASQEVGQDAPRQAEEALNDLFRDLGGIWNDVFEQQITTSFDGRFVDFIHECLVPLGEGHRTKAAISKRVSDLGLVKSNF